MVKLQCSGWWEQAGYGRQAMEQLELNFEDGSLNGTGTDIVGDFMLRGRISGPSIRLLKHYIGQHEIEYDGTYDGEGVYYGRWNYGGCMGGKWLIRVSASQRSQPNSDADILEI